MSKAEAEVVEEFTEEIAEEEQEEIQEPEAVETEDQPAETEAEEPEELHITLGDDSPSSEAEEDQPAEWVTNLRKQYRDSQKRIRELEAEREKFVPTEKPAELGAKPTLEACEWDPELFERKLEDWHETKRQVEQQAAQKQQAQQKAAEEWNAKVAAFNEAKAKLNVKGMDEAQEMVESVFSVQQQGILLHVAESPEKVVYALGKNPARLKELATITDPLKLAAAITKLETKEMKVTNRKSPPPPERVVRGQSSVAGSVDSTLERLRKEAEATGDYTKIGDYRRKQREKSSS